MSSEHLRKDISLHLSLNPNPSIFTTMGTKLDDILGYTEDLRHINVKPTATTITVAHGQETGYSRINGEDVVMQDECTPSTNCMQGWYGIMI